MIWGFVDFRNIEGNEKARPKFVVGIVTLLRDKTLSSFSLYAGSSLCSVLPPKPPAP